MSEITVDSDLWASVGWGGLLVLAVPFFIILLNELLERSGVQSRPGLVALLRFTRDLFLPVAVLYLVVRIVFDLGADSDLANIASSLFWMFLIVLVLRTSTVVIGSGEFADGDVRGRVPILFLRLVPFTLIGLIVYHISQNLWSLPVRELVATLGIGSVVIAFALQATLSNLVSGLLMIARSPFKTGDWVVVGDVTGKIVEVNWRYTELEDEEGNLVVFPNGAIADGSILNYSRPTRVTQRQMELQFSVDTPPNVIRQFVLETMRTSPGVLAEPKAEIFITNVKNPFITYEIEYWIEDYEKRESITSELLARLWYRARREGIPIPRDAREQHNFRHSLRTEEKASETSRCRSALSFLPGLGTVSDGGMEAIVAGARHLTFARGEHLLRAAEPEPGLYVVSEGTICLDMPSLIDLDGPLEVVEPGGILGAAGIFGRPISLFNARALSDCELVLIPHRDFAKVLATEDELSAYITALINRRNEVIQRHSPEQTETPLNILSTGGSPHVD